MNKDIYLNFNDVRIVVGFCVSIHSLDFDFLCGTVRGFTDKGIELYALNGMTYFCDFESIFAIEKIA